MNSSENNPEIIEIVSSKNGVSGIFRAVENMRQSSVWDRIESRLISNNIVYVASSSSIEVDWHEALTIIREFGTKQYQNSLNFRFAPKGDALERVKQFMQEFRKVKLCRDELTLSITGDEINQRLVHQGFTKRTLKDFQLRDLSRLMSISHGANFSVPGAGKTTVTYALHTLLQEDEDLVLFVVCPKAAFPAWHEIVGDCFDDVKGREFIRLDGDERANFNLLNEGHRSYMMSYDLMVRQQSLIANFFAKNKVHLVLDEAHRMKAGMSSARGAFLLSIASLPVRRDILTGTPMPQSVNDIISQLSFLWPGHGYDMEVQRGQPPREVLANLYVRTTKKELGLPPAKRHFHHVDMSKGQLALYSVVRDEALRQISRALSSGKASPDFLSARKSVMRLLQISSNPSIVIPALLEGNLKISSGIIDQIIEEDTSTKVEAVMRHARNLAQQGQKCVIWSTFTNNIVELERRLADLNPVVIYGGVPSGSSDDPTTREGRLRRFHIDPKCKIIIANPAAAGEGISLHKVCHSALYLERSYVSTHYLQSVDRIHRLGLSEEVETNIHIYQSKAPARIGSVDNSVSRRLAKKIRAMQQLLDDPDLHEIALDEEEADDPIDYDIEMEDLIDLVSELEGSVSDEDVEHF